MQRHDIPRRLHIAVFLALTLMARTVCGAEVFDTGNNLRQASEDYFLGFVLGVHDAYASRFFCVPRGVSKGQLAAIVRTYLAQNPEQWHRGAVNLVTDALAAAFPCQK